jgi:hypothetical protein
VLVLRKDREFDQGEGYSVIFEGRSIGRILFASAGAPEDRPWFWDWNFTNGSDAVARNMEMQRTAKLRWRRLRQLGAGKLRLVLGRYAAAI